MRELFEILLIKSYNRHQRADLEKFRESFYLMMSFILESLLLCITIQRNHSLFTSETTYKTTPRLYILPKIIPCCGDCGGGVLRTVGPSEIAICRHGPADNHDMTELWR